MTYQYYDNYEQWIEARYEKAILGHVIDMTDDGVIVELETGTMIDRDTYLTCPVCGDVDYHPDGPDSEVIQCRNCGFSNPRSAFPVDEISPTTDRTQYIEIVCPTCRDETVEKLRAQIQQIEASRDQLYDACKVALTGYQNILELDLMPHSGYDEGTQTLINTLSAALGKGVETTGQITLDESVEFTEEDWEHAKRVLHPLGTGKTEDTNDTN